LFTQEEKRIRRFSQFLTVLNLMQVFFLIVVISIGIISWSLYNIFLADQVTKQMRRESQELTDVQEVQVYFIQEFLAEKNYVLTGDEKYIEEYNEYKEETRHYLDDARSFASTSSETVALDNLARVTENYNDNFDQIVETYKAGDHEEAIVMSQEASEEKLVAVHEQVNDMIFSGEIRLQEEVQEVDTTIRKAIYIGVIGLMMFPVLAVWAFLVSSRMTMPFLTLTNAVSAITGNRFREELLGNVEDRRDGVGLLARSLSKTAQQIEAREAALQVEIDQLSNELQDQKARRLVTALPGHRSHTHINPN
jgi:CHASE3 domain sensor protein